MAEEGNIKAYLKGIVPRIFKAVLWGSITFLLVYYLPMQIYPLEALPFEDSQNIYVFSAITVFFVVAIKLFSETILEHAFSMTKAMVMMIYFIYIFDGGIISLSIPIQATMVNLVVDFRVFLVMLILPNLLTLAKSLLQATNFLAKRSESLD